MDILETYVTCPCIGGCKCPEDFFPGVLINGTPLKNLSLEEQKEILLKIIDKEKQPNDIMLDIFSFVLEYYGKCDEPNYCWDCGKEYGKYHIKI